VSIRIETADGAIAFAEDPTTLFYERLDVGDEFLFVQFLTWCTVGLLDEL
jgi:hypothetical protein